MTIEALDGVALSVQLSDADCEKLEAYILRQVTARAAAEARAARAEDVLCTYTEEHDRQCKATQARVETAEAALAEERTKQEEWCSRKEQLATIAAAFEIDEARILVLERQLADLRSALAMHWSDASTPEDGEIRAAHPTVTGRHELYTTAMRLVGARRSKGSLTLLVNWLLFRAETAEKK